MQKRVLIIGGCGYIGSALQTHLLKKNVLYDSVDLEIFGNPSFLPNHKIDYRLLSAMDLKSYTHIIFLAAHSSVKMANEDSSAAFYNNILGFKQLLEKITSSQRLIYASTSSVYNGVANNAVDEEWTNFSLGNMYDFSKFSNDCLAKYSGCDYIALRLGTVNGSSKNLRTDLMINRMVLTAMTEGVVKIANSKVNRPILGLQDLVNAILTIINQTPPQGIYNVASFNNTVGYIGHYVAKRLKVEVIDMPDTLTYDFSINSSKITKVTGFAFSQTLESLVEEIIVHYNMFGCVGADR
jgi:nucleoside-diphosphate-sugar epimerase